MLYRTLLIAVALAPGHAAYALADDPPPEFARWLGPQSWHRDTDGPILSLGMSERFDDTHVFAPTVVFEDGNYFMWYCGSRGTVADRVFRLGLAVSPDGRRFHRHPNSPVFGFLDNTTSLLTATLLRSPDGTALRENDSLRLWFTATNFHDPSGLHTLRESTSPDGITWSAPSAPLMQHVYAPTIIRDGNDYRMWYTDVEQEPWIIRHAKSPDGQRWTRHAPALPRRRPALGKKSPLLSDGPQARRHLSHLVRQLLDRPPQHHRPRLRHQPQMASPGPNIPTTPSSAPNPAAPGNPTTPPASPSSASPTAPSAFGTPAEKNHPSRTNISPSTPPAGIRHKALTNKPVEFSRRERGHVTGKIASIAHHDEQNFERAHHNPRKLPCQSPKNVSSNVLPGPSGRDSSPVEEAEAGESAAIRRWRLTKTGGESGS